MKCKHFLPFHRLSFHFVEDFLCCKKLFSLMPFHSIIFYFVFVFGIRFKKIIAKSDVKRTYPIQFSSVAQSCPTLCDPMNRSTPGLPVHHQLPEFTQTHVHRYRYIYSTPPEVLWLWVQVLRFKSLTHFADFVYDVRQWSSFILLHVALQFSQHYLLKKLCCFLKIISCYRIFESKPRHESILSI